VKILVLILLLATIALAQIRVGFGYETSAKMQIIELGLQTAKSIFSILAQYHYAKVLLNLSNSSLHIEIPINDNLTIIPNASTTKTFKIDLNINLR